MKIKFISAAAVLFVLILACSSTPTAIPNKAVQGSSPTVVLPTQTSIPTDTAIPTVTNTLRPTNTPLPTNTPRLTNTPKPTSTSTPTPAPVILTGSGDSVVDVNWSGPGLLFITYTGSRNFAIESYDANGNQIDLFMNTIGSYKGTVPLDFSSSDVTTRFQITASGSWEIDIQSLSMIRHEAIPGTFIGTGDDVITIYGGTPDLLVVDASTASRNFVVWGVSDHEDLLVNEIAPYTGTVILSKDTVALIINATGDWSIEVKTK